MVDPSDREQRSDPPPPDRPALAGGAIRIGAFLLLAWLALAVGVALGTFAWNAARMGGSAPAETLSTRSGADVVTAVRALARLESTLFHMERVIEMTSTQSRLFGLVQAEDSILLVAAADVVAGVDLGALRDGDVEIDRQTRRARIVLPPPTVLVTRLDSERTFVHSRRTELLAERREQLESEARRQAEQSLRESAIEAGILERAREDAARTVAALVRALGYEDVQVQYRPAEP